MESPKKARIAFLVTVAAGIILLDQITKAVVQSRFFPGESITVIPGFFNLTFIRNPGAAFGFLASGNPSIVTPLFVIISVIVAACIVYYYLKSDPGLQLHRWGLPLILGGAIGNLIDRVRFRSVVDFLDFYVGNYHWPAFNAADSAITIGVGLILLEMLLANKPGKAS
ncbi:MAG: signal peptidase II [Nitrospinota bacterium]